METLTKQLKILNWPKSYSRKNILNEGDRYYEAFVLGKVWSWAHADVAETGRCIRDSVITSQLKYKEIYELAHQEAEEFGCEYSTIQFNKNYQCKKHIDGNNVGISHIIGLGDYQGGELLIYYDGPDNPPTYVDIRNQFYSFDGSAYYHETAPFTGNRFTLVFFML
tara:strand:+ start:81 stop:578 length:498 start_codon:yes stop_codon:yes gene_type:complete